MYFEFPQVLLLRTAFFYLIVGLPMLFAPTTFKKGLERLIKNEDMMRTRGLITLLFGLAFLTVYQVIDGSLGLLFSLCGYACLIKGTRLIWKPSYAQRKFKMIFGTKAGTMITGIIMLIISALLIRIPLAKI